MRKFSKQTNHSSITLPVLNSVPTEDGTIQLAPTFSNTVTLQQTQHPYPKYNRPFHNAKCNGVLTIFQAR